MDSVSATQDVQELEKVNTIFMLNQLKRLTENSDMKDAVDMIIAKLLEVGQLAIQEECEPIIEQLKSMRIIMDSCSSDACSSCASSCG